MLRSRLAPLLVALALAPAANAQEVTVLAAASLANAFEEIGKAYRAQGGAAVRFSFAATSALARQIEAGAPASVFVSADEQWMDWLAARKLIAADTRKVIAGNALVLVMPAERARSVELKPGFDLAALLGASGRLVTGDPAHVPVGKYAQQALGALGVWPIAEPRLARADNVRAALALVERGEAPAGIVYATDAALSGKVKVAGTFPASSHAPIVYPAAIVARGDTPAARRFLEHLAGEPAAAVLRKYGFSTTSAAPAPSPR